MAYDEGTAQILRDDLTDLPVVEKKMFGGLCFMLQGNMLCGALENRAMFRVGPDSHDLALALPGARPMMFTKRPMKGFVECAPEALQDDSARSAFLALSLAFVNSLPPK